MAALKCPRYLRVGAKGRDVRAVQRALRKAGFCEHKPSGVFDEETKREVESFQRKQRLGVDGVVGPDTFAALVPHFDQLAKWLLNRVTPAKEKAPTGVRERVVAAAYHGYRNRQAIHYTQSGRRMQGVREHIRPPGFPVWEDCSSFATWCYWIAGAPDPNGKGYNGRDGYTGYQIEHGREVRDPRPGDLVFYGRSHSKINHVTVYVGNGRVISHGEEPGPELLPIDYHRKRGPRQQIRSYV